MTDGQVVAFPEEKIVRRRDIVAHGFPNNGQAFVSFAPEHYARHEDAIDAAAAGHGYALVTMLGSNAPLLFGGRYWFVRARQTGNTDG